MAKESSFSSHCTSFLCQGSLIDLLQTCHKIEVSKREGFVHGHGLCVDVFVDVPVEEPWRELLELCAGRVLLDLRQEMVEQTDLIMAERVLGRVAPEFLSTSELIYDI